MQLVGITSIFLALQFYPICQSQTYPKSYSSGFSLTHRERRAQVLYRCPCRCLLDMYLSVSRRMFLLDARFNRSLQRKSLDNAASARLFSDNANYWLYIAVSINRNLSAPIALQIPEAVNVDVGQPPVNQSTNNSNNQPNNAIGNYFKHLLCVCTL